MERNTAMVFHIREMAVDMKDHGKIINQMDLVYLYMVIRNLILVNIK
jgi:hypothetical protein